MNKESGKALTKAAGGMSLATSMSRILGYARDSLAASLFGAGWISDAYFVAFRIPNLLRDLLAEGALSSAFVPAMAKEQESHGSQRAWQLMALMLNSLLLVMAGVVLLGMAFAPELVGLAAPGFRARPGQFALTVSLTRLLFPFIAMMALAALFMGGLNSRRQFAVSAMAPIFMNLSMLGFGFFVCPRFAGDEVAMVRAWAWGALAGGFLQMAVQAPSLLAQGFRPVWAWPFSVSGVRRIWRQMAPAVLGQSTTQINLLVNTVIASSLAAGSVTYLYYGNRLMQLPLGVFGVAIATAALPDLAGHHARLDGASFRKTLGHALRLTLFITLPASVGLILLSEPINILLFNWGAFDLESAKAAARASSAYSLGIVFASFVKVLVPAFYAREESAVPVKVSFAMVALNLVLNLLLLGPLGYLGLAYSASLCSAIQVGLMVWLLRRRLGPLVKEEILADFGKLALAALSMALALGLARMGLDHGLGPEELAARSRLAWELPLLIGLSCAVYFGAAHALGVDYLQGLLVRRRKNV